MSMTVEALADELNRVADCPALMDIGAYSLAAKIMPFINSHAFSASVPIEVVEAGFALIHPGITLVFEHEEARNRYWRDLVQLLKSRQNLTTSETGA
ncbi:MAG: hypothetical protein V4636_05340 [Pseudomonadota bacterium]